MKITHGFKVVGRKKLFEDGNFLQNFLLFRMIEKNCLLFFSFLVDLDNNNNTLLLSLSIKLKILPIITSLQLCKSLVLFYLCFLAKRKRLSNLMVWSKFPRGVHPRLNQSSTTFFSFTLTTST